MSIEENKARDRRLVEEALNRGNLAVADELIAPDFVDHAAPPGMQHGPDGFKAAVAAFRSAFPDLHVTVEEQLAAGDRVARRMTMRGTHRGDLFGIPPTGPPMAIAGIHLVRLAGGTLVEHWGINDDVGMLQQLGAIPAPGQPGPEPQTSA
jgi:predicted ester cyclase